MSVRGRDLVDAPVAQAVQSDPLCVLGGSAATVERQRTAAPAAAPTRVRSCAAEPSCSRWHRDVASRPLPAGEQFLGRGLADVVPGWPTARTSGADHVDAVEITVKGQQPQVVPCQRLVAALGFLGDLGPVRS